MERAARALAALEGGAEVTVAHIERIAPLVLNHRSSGAGTPRPPPPAENHQGTRRPANPRRRGPSSPAGPRSPRPTAAARGSRRRRRGAEEGPPQAGSGDGGETTFEVGETFRVRSIDAPRDRRLRRGSGRRSRTRGVRPPGDVTCKAHNSGAATTSPWTPPCGPRAPVPAAAPPAGRRSVGVDPTGGYPREDPRAAHTATFCSLPWTPAVPWVPAGGWRPPRGAVLSLLLDAYQKRDRVAMISFRKAGAEVNLPPTASVEMAGKLLAEMAVWAGAHTLSAGLYKCLEMLRAQLRRDPVRTADPAGGHRRAGQPGPGRIQTVGRGPNRGRPPGGPWRR